MALSFDSPIYSFLQFNEPFDFDCAETQRPCLPVVLLTDLTFQVKVELTGADKTFFDGGAINAAVVLDCDAPENLDLNYAGTWTLYETGEGANPDIWYGIFSFNSNAYFSTLPVGTCFHLTLFRGLITYGCFDTCLVKISDTCYTSKLTYLFNSNMFGFGPLGSTALSVRLPFYMHSPSVAEDKKQYSKSDGSTVQLMARLWKDYQVKGDYMPDKWIDRFAVATSADEVNVISNYSSVAALVVRTEKVEVTWYEENIPTFNLGMLKTTFRLAAPIANNNSNCG